MIDILKNWLWSWFTDRSTWQTILSLLVGSFISWMVSKHYYEKLGSELQAETVQLRKLHNFTLTVLQNMQGGADAKSVVERDANGFPTGVGVVVGVQPLIGHGVGKGEGGGVDASSK